MWSLPLVAVLVAFACASPVPQASQGAIGSSTLRSELSSTESSAISSSESTERTTPTRHTLRPFSFSPRTLKTHQPSTHEPTSRRTFKPLGGAKHSTTPVASESSSTISSAAETTSSQNRLVRSIEGETWQLAESTSTAKVNEISTPSAAPHALEQSSSSAATTPAVRIGEESTSASTPSTTSLPVRSVRNAEQWNAPGWQLAETSSTASVNGISTPAQSSSSSAATTPAVRIGEESTSASTPSTTSLPVRSVRNAEQWNAPGWQLAETSSTMGVDASTTSASNDTSSTPAIGNSMEDAEWQMDESSSTTEAASSSISPAVGMSHDDGAPWPQMEESSSTSAISSSSPAVGMSHDDGAPWPQMEESSSTAQAESTSAISSSVPAMGNSMDGQNWM